jgi:uncharacterized zinc-type alcohol dehydrogenase-like protein
MQHRLPLRPLRHSISNYLGLLRLNGVLICLGVAPDVAHVSPLNLIFTRRSMGGSLIGGLPETQEMLDYCAKHKITSDVEVIPIQQINQAYDRTVKGDLRYRFVIDLASLK